MTCVWLRATLSHKIFNSEKYKRSRDSSAIIECLWWGNDECSTRTKVGLWFFEWMWRSTRSRTSFTCHWAAERLWLVCFWMSPYSPTSPRLIFIFFWSWTINWTGCGFSPSNKWKVGVAASSGNWTRSFMCMV